MTLFSIPLMMSKEMFAVLGQSRLAPVSAQVEPPEYKEPELITQNIRSNVQTILLVKPILVLAFSFINSEII